MMMLREDGGGGSRRLWDSFHSTIDNEPEREPWLTKDVSLC